jgi:tetratricopeptide (TPR) repeat protein
LLGALVLPGVAQTQQDLSIKAETNTIEKAESLLSSGKIDEAITVLLTMSKSGSNDGQLSHLLGLAYYQKGDNERAVEHLSVAVKRTPEDSRHRQDIQMLALSHYLLGHIKEAIPYLEQVKSWAPDNVEMAYTLGISYIQIHNPDKARESFARMFSVSPASASAYLINAQMMIRQQFEEFAVKELQKALELDPKLPQANFPTRRNGHIPCQS